MKLDFDKIKENASRMDAGQRPGYKAQSVAPASQSPLNFERVIANAKLRDEQSGVHAAPKPAPAVAPRQKPIAPKLPTYRPVLDSMADGAMPLSPFARKKLDDARLSPVRTKGLTAERDRLDAKLTQSQNSINAGESADVDGMKRDQYRINGLNRQLDTQKAELYEAGLAGQRAAMEQKAGPVSGVKLSPGQSTVDLLQTYPGYGPAPRDKNGVTDAARYLSDPEFRKAAQARMKQDNTLDDAFEPLDYMTETERNTLIYYVQAGDLQSAEKYKALLDRTLNARRQQKQSATMERAAKENPILGTVNNLLSSFGSGFALAGTAGQAVKNLVTGKDEPTDYNSKWFKNAHVMNDTAQGVHRAAYDAAGGGTWGEIAAGAADMGLSLGQTVTKIPLGPAALPMMALTAGGQSSLGALERGASTGQALAFGTTTGLVEALTEKLPLDALFAIAKTGKKGVKAVLGSVLKQMGSEASEEMVSELAGTLADKAIIGTRSEYENYVADLVSQGMDEEQARQAATKQFYLHNVAKAGLGGAVTGGVMAGGANIIGSIGNKNAQAPLKPNRLLTGKEQFEQSQVQNGQKKSAEGADFKAYVEDSISKSRFVETPVISSEVKPPLDIGAVSKGLADKILGEYNVDISAKRHQVNDNDLRHIYNRHGPHTNEKYPVTIGDLIEIPNIIDHADDVYFVSRRDGKSGLVYQKRRNGTTYYLEQIVDNSDVLQNKQMIKVPTGTYPDIPGLRDAIEKKRSISPAPDGSAYAAPQMYAQGVRDNASLDPTLSQGQSDVNTEDMQNGGKDTAVPQSHRLLTGKEQFEQSQVQNGQKNTAEGAVLPKMSMADFTDAESSVWNNVEYDDTETRADLQGRAHQEMVDAGQVVHIPEDTIAQTGESFPDLRTVKKKERVPMLKQKMNELKSTLRGFLGQLKGGSYEFEVNGNILETRLYDTGINEVMEKVTQDKASMLYHSEEIFKNARYLYSTPDYEGNPNIYRWNYFYTPVKIGTETVGVRIAVRDMVYSKTGAMDSQIYNWGIKKGTTLDGEGRGQSRGSPGVSSVVPSGAPLDGGQRGSMPDQSSVSSGVPSDITLPQGKSGVNTEGMQNGGEDAPATPNSGNTPGGYEGGTVGSAKSGFDQYSHLQNQKDKFHPDGEEPRARQVDVPTTDFDGRSIPKSAATIAEAAVTPDNAVGVVEDEIAHGNLSFDTITDASASARAQKDIDDNGFEGVLALWREACSRGVVSKDIIATGQLLLKNAYERKDGKAIVDILVGYTSASTNSAQAMQAQRMLKKLSPQGQLYGITRSVQNLQGELNKRMGDKAPTLAMDQTIMDGFLNATDQDGRDKAMLDIRQSIADQVPATWMDKWNAWRYMAMLANPRTHIRNTGGNVGFQPVRILKDRVGAFIEWRVSKTKRGKNIERTKSFLYSPELYRATWGDYAVSKDLLEQGSRYHDNQGEIEKLKPIFNKGIPTKALEQVTGKTFKSGIMENIRKGNSWLLEVEDAFFKRMTYADALAGSLRAHGVTAADMASGTVDAGLLDRARAYAIQEALKATYQDRNMVSDIAASFGRGSKTIAGKALSALSEGVLPFRRTPANILVRGAEYSPLGLAKSLTYDLYKVKKGDMTAAEAIDGIASGLTGSALMGLGVVLFSIGLVSSGGGDDEKEDAMRDITGGQDYALQLPGGGSVTLDWLAPESLPFFMGVELADSIGQNGLSAQNLGDTLGAVADPMLKMSMLQSLNDALDSISYSDNKLQALVSSALVSYLGQAVPTIGGQIERTAEDKRMTTYTDKNNKWLSTDMQYAIGRSSARVPGRDFQQIPYIDAWGRTESTGSLGARAANNFLNPAFVSKSNVTAVDSEVLRLYRKIGAGEVVPDRAPKYLTISGEKIDLDKNQYLQYAKERGSASLETANLMIGSTVYKGLTDQGKASAIAGSYEYADAIAKKNLGLGYLPDDWVLEAEKLKPEKRVNFLLARQVLSDVGSGEGATDRKRNALISMKNMTAEEKAATGMALGIDTRMLDYSSAEALTISTMPESTREKAKAAKKARISDKVFIAAYEAQKGIVGDKDRNGETVELSAARKKKAAIDRAARGLTYAQKTTLYEMFGVSRKVWAELLGG